MSIEFSSEWRRPPTEEDKAALIAALTTLGTPLAGTEPLIARVTSHTSTHRGVDLSLFIMPPGPLIAFHSATRSQRHDVIGRINEVLLQRGLACPLTED